MSKAHKILKTIQAYHLKPKHNLQCPRKLPKNITPKNMQ